MKKVIITADALTKRTYPQCLGNDGLRAVTSGTIVPRYATKDNGLIRYTNSVAINPRDIIADKTGDGNVIYYSYSNNPIYNMYTKGLEFIAISSEKEKGWKILFKEKADDIYNAMALSIIGAIKLNLLQEDCMGLFCNEILKFAEENSFEGKIVEESEFDDMLKKYTFEKVCYQ